jgi:antitoxin (DNA-binding transcriptional repressor) of toxin-antitoxin stability system
VREGDEVIVTDRGNPIARVVPIDHSTDRLAELIAAGVVHPPKSARRRTREERHRVTPIGGGSVSDLVADQRR